MALPQIATNPWPCKCHQIDLAFSSQLMSYSICSKKISWVAELVPQSSRTFHNTLTSYVIDGKRGDNETRTSQVKDVGGINLNTKTSSNEERLKQTVGHLYLMNHEGICPDSNAYASVLQICTNMKSLTEGMRVHTHMIKTGLKPVVYLENNLLSMYIKCGNLPMARQVFDKMSKRDNVSWAAMISGHAQAELGKDVLYLFHEMQRAGIKPNEFTFVSVLKVCAALEALGQGKQIHATIIKKELDSNAYLGSVLVDLYAKCGRLSNARHVFDTMSVRDVVSWTAMISGYAQQGHDEALKLFYEMQRAGVNPNKFTFTSVLRACAGLEVPDQGRQFHSYVIKAGFESSVYVGRGIVNKMAGRIGDTPIIGAGTYANHLCAVSATGRGETIIRATVAHDVAARMEYKGSSLKEAADYAVRQCTGGLVAVSCKGEVAMPFNTSGMFRACAKEDGFYEVGILN